jgi:hypothetical protein
MDNKLTKFLSGALGGAFDATMSSFPGIAIAWGALKGGVSNIRTKRAEDFILFIQNNFNLNYFNDENFIDGLAITFDSFLKQRNKNKREIIKNIFLGFSGSENKEEFEIERMYDIVYRISEKQIRLFIEIKKQKKIVILSQEYGEIKNYNENYDEYKYLEFLGLVAINQEKNIKTMYGGSQIKEEEEVFITDFGSNFIRFILN